jgi:hypothetical protein
LAGHWKLCQLWILYLPKLKSKGKHNWSRYAGPEWKFNLPEIEDAFIALADLTVKIQPSWRLEEDHFSRIGEDVLSKSAWKIDRQNYLLSLHMAVTSVLHPCGCHNDSATNLKNHPDVLCV